MKPKIIVVDDENTQLRIMASVLERGGYHPVTVASGRDAVDLCRSDGAGFAAMVLDLSMPEMDGVAVLEQVRPRLPDLPILVLTSHSSIRNVVASMRAGATDFLVKPASSERILSAIRQAIDTRSSSGELRPLSEKLPSAGGFDELIGKSSAFLHAVEMAKKGASTTIPMLLEGESGVGKEMFAQAIQLASPRATKPLITVNCGAIPSNLVESLLFGHEKGAFTGATEKHAGKFVEANGGTLFLDEIGELPLETQVKLLRTLQEGEVDPVGGRAPVKVDVRVISATNRSLVEEVAKGNFREDLYYRLNVFPIHIPPLRNRQEDIADLTLHFIERICTAENIAKTRLTPAAADLLEQFSWPGNVRQLQNAVFRAVVLSTGGELTVADFPQIAQQVSASEAGDSSLSFLPGMDERGLSQGLRRARPAGLGLFNEDGDMRKLAELEADIIRHALRHYAGHMSKVARKLGIGRSTLYRKVAEYDLDGSPDPNLETAVDDRENGLPTKLSA